MLKLKSSLITIIILLYIALVCYITTSIVTSIKDGYYDGIYEIAGILFIILLGGSIPVIFKELKDIRLKKIIMMKG